MDTFMDKLAQKLTAQEMIRANTAAETEEMNRLKNRISEYNECLDRLQKLIASGVVKLDEAKVDGGEINRLVQESIAKIQEMQNDAQVMEELEASLNEMKVMLEGQLNEKIENSNENVHKECVKVYRNVQAVVVEESGKQTENIANVQADVKKLTGKVNAVLGISIAALIAALAGLALQILVNFNIM